MADYSCLHSRLGSRSAVDYDTVWVLAFDNNIICFPKPILYKTSIKRERATSNKLSIGLPGASDM